LATLFAGCYSPRFESCVVQCQSDSACAPGHECLASEGLCLEKGDPAGECVGAEASPPVDPWLRFWFAGTSADNTSIGRFLNAPAIAALLTSNLDLRSSPWQGVELQPGRTFEPPLTIAAWIKPNSRGGRVHIVTSAFTTGAEEDVPVAFSFDTDGRLGFGSACSGKTIDQSAVWSSGKVSQRGWTHVAVAWSGKSVMFYIDGKPAGRAALLAEQTGCFGGVVVNGLYLMDGDQQLDILARDIRFFDVRLDETAIAGLAEEDVHALQGDCGDGAIDPGEECDDNMPCCNQVCQFSDDFTPCGNGDVCIEGVCTGSEEPQPTLGYAFDYAPNGGQAMEFWQGLDLSLITESGTTITQTGPAWSIGGRALASAPIGSALSSCEEGGGLSIELVLRNDAADKQSLSRIVSLSDDLNGGKHRFDLGGLEDRFAFRFHTLHSDFAGRPTLATAQPDDGSAKHVVAIADPVSGERSLYVNGVRRAHMIGWPGGLPEIDPATRFALFNSASCFDSAPPLDEDCRDWRGDIYLVQIYCRVLSQEEVGFQSSNLRTFFGLL
jgi:hypothetical protein